MSILLPFFFFCNRDGRTDIDAPPLETKIMGFSPESLPLPLAKLLAGTKEDLHIVLETPFTRRHQDTGKTSSNLSDDEILTTMTFLFVSVPCLIIVCNIMAR